MASRRELLRPQIQEAITLQYGECDVVRRMATLFFTSEAQSCKSEFLLFSSGISLSAPANVVDASSFLLALTFTSLHIRVWDSKINLFRDAVFPGFNGMGCSSGCNCASVSVCPGWQAANASPQTM